MENQQQSVNTLCRAGCGFFGSASTEGLCSKCFKDSIKKKQDTGRATPPNSITSSAAVAAALLQQAPEDLQAKYDAAVASAQANVAGSTPSMSSSSSSASLAIETVMSGGNDTATATEASTSGSSASTPTGKNKPNRCQICKKRVGLTGFPCRCGGLYCGEHRYDTAHNCQFDYKTIEREEIRKNNPVVMSEKIQRI